jgi:hypothetical protein
MPLTIQLDFDMGDFRHEPMVCDQRGRASTPAHWSGKLAWSVR